MIIPQRNIDRAARIDKIRARYQEIVDNDVQNSTTHLDLASMAADMRHWCDLHDIDFGSVIEISAEHYAQEQGEDGE